MTRREELQKQWTKYKRRLDAVRETKPENARLEAGEMVTAVYFVDSDALEITRGSSVTLSGDEAEKLYHFLGGLYG
jgi:hypothetical protein